MRRWLTSPAGRSLLWGAVGMIGIALIALVLWMGYLTYWRAVNGQHAFEYLIQLQQQQGAAQTPPPLPPK